MQILKLPLNLKLKTERKPMFDYQIAILDQNRDFGQNGRIQRRPETLGIFPERESFTTAAIFFMVNLIMVSSIYR